MKTGCNTSQTRRSRAEPTTVLRAGSSWPSQRRSSVPVRRCRCRLLGVVRRRAGTSREPPSSTSAVDKVTARHYWGAADQGDVEAGEEEEADEEGGGCLVRMAGNQKRGGEYDEFGGKRTRGYNDGRFEMRVLVPSRVSLMGDDDDRDDDNLDDGDRTMINIRAM